MLGTIRQFFSRLFHRLTKSQYSLGIKLYNDGSYEEAADALSLIRDGIYRTSLLYTRLSNFYFYRALRNAALLAFYQGDYIRCIRHCQQALEVEPDEEVCRNYLAHAFHHVGQYGASIRQLETLRRSSPDRDDIRYNLAKINIKAGRTATARKIINELIEESPDFADFHHILGIAYGKEGNIEKAIESFTTAVSINQGFVNAVLLLGLEQIRSFNYHTACRTFKAGMTAKPNNSDLLFYYGLTCSIVTRLEAQGVEANGAAKEQLGIVALPSDLLDDIAYLDGRALEEHNRMLELDISYGEHFTFLDPIYDKPALEALVEVFESFINIYPTYADYFNKLGTFYKKIGDIAKAEAVLNTALEINPNYIDALVSLGGVYESEGRVEEAYEISHKVTQLAPEQPELQVTHGRLSTKLRDFDTAADSMISAAEIDNRYTYHLFVLGQILEENGDDKLAKKCRDVGRRLMPDAARDLRGFRRFERSLN